GACRLAVVAAEGDDLAATWPAALAVGAEVVVGPGGGDLGGWLLTAAAGAAGAVGVVGGRGGAGASTAAVALARAGVAAVGGAVLVDADPVGGGLDLALGAEALAGLRWPDLCGAPGAPGPGLVAALPRVDGVAVVSHGRDRGGGERRPDSALTASLLDTCLAGGRPVVVDLPRRGDPATRAALSRCAVLVVVVPAEVRACAGAGALLDELGTTVADVRLLVRGPAPAGLAAEDVAAAVGIPSFAEVRPEPGLAAALDRGERIAASARSPLRAWAAGVIATGPGAR
ncbi:MAG: septum site-determining protein Ssd, partial [Kineosporiaceae bacterium]